MTAIPPRHVEPRMVERIHAELTAIASEHGVRILLAVESGSRAWGFPSTDSDYDVRFLYLRPVEHYLTVVPRRDVIERPVDAVLDVNGWDIRKALQLLLKSNAVLQEWLSSPVRYVEAGPVPCQLLELMTAGADLRAFEYHYDRLARRSFGEVADANDTVPLKSYCYTLRATLALHWLRHRRTPPPMDVTSLMGGLDLPAAFVGEIRRLIDRKACATERETTSRVAVIDSFIQHTMAQTIGPANAVNRPDITARADALLASIVLG